MITNLTLTNFKAFEYLDVEFAPITVFLGPNNSGKSSILSSLRLLAQTLDASEGQVPLQLNGVLGDFGTYRDVVFNNFRGRPIGIALSVKPNISPNSSGKTVTIDWDSNAATSSIDLEYKYRTGRRELILRSVNTSLNNEPILSVKYSVDSEKHLIQSIGNMSIPSAIKSQFSELLRMDSFIPNLRTYLRFESSEQSALKDFLTKDITRKIRLSNETVREIRGFLNKLDYLGPMRALPTRTYLFAGQRARKIGSSGENTVNIFSALNSRSKSAEAVIIDAFKTLLVSAGIASDVRIKPISDRFFEILVQHPITKEYQNLVDVGQGISQVLPVLIGGLRRGATGTFVVEEPEIHLHPRAQAAMSDLFMRLYKTGVQSIIETHSEYLIVKLQQYVASGDVHPDHIRIYYVYPKNGKKDITQLRLDAQGKFIDEWPEGFFSERLEEAKRLAQIRFQNENLGES